MRCARCIGLLTLLCLGSAASATQPNVLVLLEDLVHRSTHSVFFASLEAQGFVLDFRSVSDSSLKLKDYDTWLYEKAVIFASQATGRV